jgi:hypothetical protein
MGCHQGTIRGKKRMSLLWRLASVLNWCGLASLVRRRKYRKEHNHV